MKTFAIMLIFLVGGDFALFSGEHVHQAWHATLDQLKSIQTYADEKTGSLTRA